VILRKKYNPGSMFGIRKFRQVHKAKPLPV